MTQSSPFGGRRDFDLALFGEDDSINTVMVRDYVYNNALHAADQIGARVLVNSMAADDTYIVDNVDQFTTGYLTDDRWWAVGAFGPFNVSVRLDSAGEPAPYVIRASAYAASASALSTVNYALLLVPGTSLGASVVRSYAIADVVDGVNAIVLGSTSSTTPAWLTPTSGWCRPNMSAVDGYVTNSVIDVPGSTSYTASQSMSVGAYLLAYGTAAPRVYGLHVAEFYG